MKRETYEALSPVHQPFLELFRPYEGLVRLLKLENHFKFTDCSVPRNDPIHNSIMHCGRDRHAGGSQRLSRTATGKERRGFVQGDGCQAGGRDLALRKAEALTDLAVPVPGPARSAQGVPGQDCDLTIRILRSGPPRQSLSDLVLEQALTVRLDFMPLCGSSVAERPGPRDGLPVSPVACAASAAPSGRGRGRGGASVGDHVPGRPGGHPQSLAATARRPASFGNRNAERKTAFARSCVMQQSDTRAFETGCGAMAPEGAGERASGGADSRADVPGVSGQCGRQALARATAAARSPVLPSLWIDRCASRRAPQVRAVPLPRLPRRKAKQFFFRRMIFNARSGQENTKE